MSRGSADTTGVHGHPSQLGISQAASLTGYLVCHMRYPPLDTKGEESDTRSFMVVSVLSGCIVSAIPPTGTTR